MSLHDRLTRAALAYDARCARAEAKLGINNPYRIGIILGAIERAEADIVAGAPVRTALCANFNDRLLAAKAAGLPPPCLSEARGYGVQTGMVHR